MRYLAYLLCVLIIPVFMLGVCVGGYLSQPNLPAQLTVLQDSKLHEAMQQLALSQQIEYALSEAEQLYQQADAANQQATQKAQQLTRRLQEKHQHSAALAIEIEQPKADFELPEAFESGLVDAPKSFSLNLKLPQEMPSVAARFNEPSGTADFFAPNFFAPAKPARLGVSPKLLWDETIESEELDLLKSLDAIEGIELEVQIKLP